VTKSILDVDTLGVNRLAFNGIQRVGRRKLSLFPPGEKKKNYTGSYPTEQNLALFDDFFNRDRNF
jgi:hypothetical protein